MNIEKDILKICTDIILNSKITDWDKKVLVKDNVTIECYIGYFSLKIFKNNEHVGWIYQVDLARHWWYIKNSKIGFFKNIKLKIKHRNIIKNFDEKEKNQKMMEIYNLLPIKIIRKEKLKKINKLKK